MIASLLLPLLAAAPPEDSTVEVIETATASGAFVAEALDTVVSFGILAMIAGIVLCLYRLLRGPHLGDRVLAADTLSILVVGLVLLLTIRLDIVLFFDAVLAVAIIGFAATVAFAQYMAARAEESPPEELEA